MKKFLLSAAFCTLSTVALQAQVTQINGNNSLEFTSHLGTNKGLFVSEVNKTLWVSDGSSAGTVQLSSTITFEEIGMLLNDKLIFVGSTPATGEELFITDGTTTGTTLLKDINTGTTSSEIGAGMAILNGYIYFTAVNPTYGREIWRTDGTPGNTTLFKDIVTGPTGSNTEDDFDLFSNGSYLLFNAQTGANGIELWKSNGTDAGTNVLKDINTGTPSSNATNFFKLGNTVLFYATLAGYGSELWKTDGTTGGTVMVKDIYSGPASSGSVFSPIFFEFNGQAFFNANDGTNGEELWVTDGTLANTNMVKNIQAGVGGSLNLLFDAIRVGNKFVFPSTNFSGSRFQLWVSDGTNAGTTLLKDFTHDEGDIPFILINYDFSGGTASQPLFGGNKFFFVANTEVEGSELWISDGTVAGTHLVKNIGPAGADGVEDLSYQYTSDALYFAANNGALGAELWKSNGTDAGTVMVADIRVGTGSSEPSLWPIFNNKLTFTAQDGSHTATDLYVLNSNVTPLPVKWGEFTVRATVNDALLQWTTAQEVNSDKFIVQRSFDGVTFHNIGVVAAAGQSGSRRTYAFTDAGIINRGNAMLYYRLEAVDKDGKKELSKTVSLKTAAANWNVNLLNNPVHAYANLTITGISGTAMLKISDVNGKTLVTTPVTNNGNQSVATSGLPKGLYYITIESAGTRKTIPFIKE